MPHLPVRQHPPARVALVRGTVQIARQFPQQDKTQSLEDDVAADRVTVDLLRHAVNRLDDPPFPDVHAPRQHAGIAPVIMGGEAPKVLIAKAQDQQAPAGKAG